MSVSCFWDRPSVGRPSQLMKRASFALFCPGALVEGAMEAALKGHILLVNRHPVQTKGLLGYMPDAAWACMQSQLGPLNANCQAMALEKGRRADRESQAAHRQPGSCGNAAELHAAGVICIIEHTLSDLYDWKMHCGSACTPMRLQATCWRTNSAVVCQCEAHVCSLAQCLGCTFEVRLHGAKHRMQGVHSTVCARCCCVVADLMQPGSFVDGRAHLAGYMARWAWSFIT